MLLLAAPSTPIAGLLPARCASSIPVSDSRRRRGTHPAIAATIHARKLATLDAISDFDWPAPAYVSRRRLPMAVASHTETWADPVEIIPADKMFIEPPSKRMVAFHREINHESRTGKEALHAAASKLPRKTAEERTAEVMKRAQDAFWDGFNTKQAEFAAKRKESSNVGI